jgi:hypothetical protein
MPRKAIPHTAITPNPAASVAPSINSLREMVTAMRDLGVLEWGDIKLGPPPLQDDSLDENNGPVAGTEEWHKAKEREAEQLLYAASGG